jgi:squalene monooxygenase
MFRRGYTKSTEKFTKTVQYDAIVVGAGVCGITLSHTLAKLGKKVLVVEKDVSNAERFVGEVLQPAGCNMLRELGLGECLEGIDAQIVNGYGVYMKDFKQALPYEDKQTGRSYHHAKFVKNLRDATMKHSK